MKLECKRADNYVSVFFSIKIPFVKKTFRHHTILYNSPDAWVHGYSSRTEQGQYVLFHDYDNLDLKSIMQELRFLQKKYKLSAYYIFKLDRENSFHAVCLDTFPISKCYEIQKATSCDLAFIHSIKNLQTKEWILRIGGKGSRNPPKFYMSIPSRNKKEHEKSSAHKDFLIKMFGVPKEFFKGKRWDKCKNLALVDYNTANRVVKKEVI
jgi:hypothetical protein